MPSFRARLVNSYLRMSMKAKPLHEIDAATLRDWVEARVIPLLPRGVALEKVAAPVAGEWHRPADADPARTILYLHGGGYVFGSPRTHRTLTFPLALAAGADVFSAEYRLAPEHPCPAAIEDAVAAYEGLAASGRDPSRMIVAGDSAGGGLALALMGALKAKRARLPAALILYSPWTDLASTGDSFRRNQASDAMFMAAAIENGGRRYAGALSLKDPRVSPLYADLTGLPPMLVFASRAEMLFDDSSRLVEKVRAAGVAARFEARDGLAHVWPLFHPLMPESKEAIRLSGDFAREMTGGAI